MSKITDDIQISDFTYGAVMGDAEVASWVMDMIKTLQNSEGDFATKSSGRAIAIAVKQTYDHEPDNPVIVVYEIKNGYKKYTIPQTDK